MTKCPLQGCGKMSSPWQRSSSLRHGCRARGNHWESARGSVCCVSSGIVSRRGPLVLGLRPFRRHVHSLCRSHNLSRGKPEVLVTLVHTRARTVCAAVLHRLACKLAGFHGRFGCIVPCPPPRHGLVAMAFLNSKEGSRDSARLRESGILLAAGLCCSLAWWPATALWYEPYGVPSFF